MLKAWTSHHQGQKRPAPPLDEVYVSDDVDLMDDPVHIDKRSRMNALSHSLDSQPNGNNENSEQMVVGVFSSYDDLTNNNLQN